MRPSSKPFLRPALWPSLRPFSMHVFCYLFSFLSLLLVLPLAASCPSFCCFLSFFLLLLVLPPATSCPQPTCHDQSNAKKQIRPHLARALGLLKSHCFGIKTAPAHRPPPPSRTEQKASPGEGPRLTKKLPFRHKNGPGSLTPRPSRIGRKIKNKRRGGRARKDKLTLHLQPTPPV